MDDIRSGMNDAELMAKHDLSPRSLQSLFKQLVQAGHLDASFLRQRTVTEGGDAGAESGPSRSQVPEGAVPDDQGHSGQFKEIADDIKSGLHDSEIMRRYELSPGKLTEIKHKLVELRYLQPEQVSPAETGGTKLCPFCSQQIKKSAIRCVHCGQRLEPTSSPVGMGRPVAGMPLQESPFAEEAGEEEKDCPWEDRESYGTASAYFQTATKCLLTPTAFFSKLPTRDGYLNPILFGVVTLVVGVVVAYLWSRLFAGGRIGLIGLVISIGVVFIVAWIVIPIGLFVWSGILHGCLYLVKGVTEGYQATFRVVAYSSVTGVFNAIPFVGTVASLWAFVLTAIGLREVHKTTTGKAVAAVLIPVAIVIVIVLVAALKMYATGGDSAIPSIEETYTGGPLTGDVCAALENYIEKVDGAKGLDADAAKTQIHEAMQTLEDVLKPLQDQKGINQVRQKALVFGLATLSQGQLNRALGGKLDLSRTKGGSETLREELMQMCGK